MAMRTRISAEANDQKSGMTIEEVLEFASAVEVALTRGDLKRDDLILASIGFSAQIKRMSIMRREDDKGKWNTA